MTDRGLPDQLAFTILGWRPGVDRYLRTGREWIKREHFQPCSDDRSAFRLLDAVTDDYSIRSTPGKGVTVVIRRGSRTATVFEASRARAITLGLAQIFDLRPDGPPKGELRG